MSYKYKIEALLSFDRTWILHFLCVQPMSLPCPWRVPALSGHHSLKHNPIKEYFFLKKRKEKEVAHKDIKCTSANP